MTRTRRRRRHPAQLAILLLLLAILAGTLLFKLNRTRSAIPAQAEETAAAAPAASPAPSPAPTSASTPAPKPSYTPTPIPTPDGHFRSGDPELDMMLYAAVEEQTDEEMSDEEKLHALFQYVAGNFRYLRRNYYEVGDTSWINGEAMTMLTAGKGNCYNFSSLFYLLARCIGYDAQIYSGTIYGQAKEGETRPPDRPHSWVEINMDGVDYIFDADMQATAAGWRYDDSFYMQGDGIRNQYGYSRGETEDAEETGEVDAGGEDAQADGETPDADGEVTEKP